MFNPTYLVKSRLGVFHLRWPIPKQLHPQQRASYIKLSLQTRDPRKALHLSRALSHIGQRLNESGIAHGMRYEEVRKVLTEHFRQWLDEVKTQINETGPLSELDRQGYKSGKLVSKHAIKTYTPLSLVKSDEELLSRFIDKYDLDISKDSQAYDWLGREIKLSYHGFTKAVLAYDKSMRRYDFESGPASPVGDKTELPKLAGMTISEVAAAYSKERQRGNAWAAKTILEKADHIKLLEEILGGDIDICALTAMDAKRVKDTLLAYPRNRAKNPMTRGKPLADVLGMPDVEIIKVPTINKYLQTYSELFEWAKQNHLISENLFSGLTLKQSKKNKEDQRDPYTDEQIQLILRTIMLNERELVTKPYQKWASLIGIYTGARLGEISQLHLADIRQQDGIWFFDMNTEGDRKSLKTSAGRRLVPIHQKLLDAGLLDYVQEMRDNKQTRLFPGFNYDAKNGWGRQQGRWFNNTLLVKLGLKTRTRVLHSLRHTVNTRLVHAGVPDAMIKAILGHAPDGMTYKQYFKEGFTLKQLNEAMQKLDYGLPEQQT